jgi:hypothetical protein
MGMDNENTHKNHGLNITMILMESGDKTTVNTLFCP